MEYHIEHIPEKIDLLALHAKDPASYPYLLQSTSSLSGTSQYDLLLCAPGTVLKKKQSCCWVNGEKKSGTFLELLDQLWRQERQKLSSTLSTNSIGPFKGGWFIYLGYELVQEIETSLDLQPSEYNLPDAMAVRCPVAVIVDHKTLTTAIKPIKMI